MRAGLSLFMIAFGAILTFAVKSSPSGFDINVAGAILMIVGLAGLALSAWWATSRQESKVIQTGPAGTRETIIVTPNEFDSTHY